MCRMASGIVNRATPVTYVKTHIHTNTVSTLNTLLCALVFNNPSMCTYYRLPLYHACHKSLSSESPPHHKCSLFINFCVHLDSPFYLIPILKNFLIHRGFGHVIYKALYIYYANTFVSAALI